MEYRGKTNENFIIRLEKQKKAMDNSCTPFVTHLTTFEHEIETEDDSSIAFFLYPHK